MAYTYPRRGIKIKAEDSYLSTLIRKAPEEASATFLEGFPLINDGGYISVAANTVAANTLIGFAARDGRNGATDGLYESEYYPAVRGMLFFANLLNDSDPHNTTLAYAQATHFLVATEIQIDSNITEEGGKAAAHVSDGTTAPAALLVGMESDHTPENTANARGIVEGDLNVRALFEVYAGALLSSVPES